MPVQGAQGFFASGGRGSPVRVEGLKTLFAYLFCLFLLPLPLEASAPPLAPPEAVLRAYAPLVWLHGKEEYLPTDAERFLAESSLWARGRKVAGPGQVKDISRAPSDSYLVHEKAGGRSLASASIRAPLYWKLSDHPVLGEFPAPAGRRHFLVEYWVHYPFNDAGLWGIGNHEGDWEGVAVWVEEELASGRHRALALYYAAHEGGKWFCPGEVSWSEGGHPEAFASRGSHATYAEAGAHFRVAGFDYAERGRPWESWESLKPLEAESFFGYQGRWGAAALFGFMSGPKVPAPGSKVFPKGSADKESRRLASVMARCPR